MCLGSNYRPWIFSQDGFGKPTSKRYRRWANGLLSAFLSSKRREMMWSAWAGSQPTTSTDISMMCTIHQRHCHLSCGNLSWGLDVLKFLHQSNTSPWPWALCESTKGCDCFKKRKGKKRWICPWAVLTEWRECLSNCAWTSQVVPGSVILFSEN